MAEWFEDWFASDLYLDVYKHRNEEDALKLLKLISENISINKSDLILDAACGAGRYSKILTEHGYNVLGFDLSLPLLKVAKKKLLEIDPKTQLPLFRADLREVQLKKRLKLILNVFTSFGYFETDDENFRFAGNSINFLVDGGYFVFDFINQPYLENNLVPESEKKIDGYVIREIRKIEKGRVIKTIKIMKDNNQQKFIESVKLYSKKEIVNRFERIGFNVLKVFGNYDGDDYNELSSDRLIIIFQK